MPLGGGILLIWVLTCRTIERRKKRSNFVICACSLVERIVLNCCYVLCVKHSNSCYVQGVLFNMTSWERTMAWQTSFGKIFILL